MGPLEQAKSAIIRQFDALATTDQQASIVHFQTKVESDVDLLAWMKGQSVYPQFYLRFRDEAKTVAAVGKVRSFSERFCNSQVNIVTSSRNKPFPGFQSLIFT